MGSQIEQTRSRPPIVRRATAALVLAIIGYLLLHTIISVVLSIVVVVAVVVAVGWALKTLL